MVENSMNGSMILARIAGVFIAATVSAHAADTVLNRVDGETQLTLREDSTFTHIWLESKSTGEGVFEETSCWNTQNKSITGSHMFYTAGGDSCCISMREVGSKVLLDHIAGYTFKVCNGGVFEKAKN